MLRCSVLLLAMTMITESHGAFSSTCPPLSGMTNYGAKWFNHAPQPLTFDQALSYCSGLGEGIHLATVTNQEDLDHYQQYSGNKIP